MVASVGIYVQAFFLWRLYMISGRKCLAPALLSPVLLLAYTAVALAVCYVLVPFPTLADDAPQTYYISREDTPHISIWCEHRSS